MTIPRPPHLDLASHAPVRPRSRFGLIRFAALLGVLSCLPSAPEDRQVEIVVQGDAAILPDSMVWVSGNARGHAELSATPGGLRLELPIDRMEPVGMTLTGWKSSIQTTRLQYVPDEDRGAKLVSREINAGAIRVLELYDSLHAVDALRYPAPTPILLSALYARGLLRGDSAFARFPETVPIGLSTRTIDSLALLSIVESGATIDSLGRHWLLPYGVDSARTIFADLVARKRITVQEFGRMFPDQAPEISRALSLSPRLLLVGGGRISLEGRFSDDSGIAATSIEVYEGDTNRSALFEITPPTQASPSEASEWSLAGATLRSSSATPGMYRVQVSVADSRDQRCTASVLFQVDDPPRLLPATPHLSGDTLFVLQSQADAGLSWRVESGHAVAVTIDGDPAIPSSGSYSRNLAKLPIGLSRAIIRLTDSAGTNLSDTLWVRRLESDPLPPDPPIPGLGLLDLGPLPNGIVAQRTSDSTWRVSIPSAFDTLSLFPHPEDSAFRLYHADTILTSPLHIRLSPQGGASTLHLEVRGGAFRRAHSIVLDHAAPTPITFRLLSPTTYAWADSTPLSRWALEGSRLLGTVKIQGNVASCTADICEIRSSALREGTSTIMIEASYAGLPTIWSSSAQLTRVADTTKPLAIRIAGTTTRIVPFDTTDISVSWSVSDDNRLARVTIQGTAALLTGPSIYWAKVPLEEGANDIVLVAEDAAGNHSMDTVAITRAKDVTRPTLAIDPFPPEAVGPSIETYELRCLASDNDRVESVQAGGKAMTLIAGREDSGIYQITLDLAAGVNTVSLVALDPAGNATAPKSIVIRRDTSAPAIKGRNPPPAAYPWTRGGTFTAEWRLEDDHRIAEVLIGGEAVKQSGDVFSRAIPYQPGKNEIILVAKDVVGNATRDTMRFETKLFDKDRNEYKIQLMPDGKVWMGQELITIPSGPPELVRECYSDSCSRYGRFYSWNQAMNLDSSYNNQSALTQLTVPMRGICPDGWHIPDSTEWNALFIAVANKHNLVPAGDSVGIIPLRSSWLWGDRGGEYPGTDFYQEFFIPYDLKGRVVGYYQSRVSFWLPKEAEHPYMWWARRIDITRTVESWDGPKAYNSFARCVAD